MILLLRALPHALVALSILAVMTSTPAAAQTVKAGDNVAVELSCRLADGGLVMTSRPEEAHSKDVSKSSIFLTSKEYKPIEVFAGSGYGGPSFGPLTLLESGIGAEISREIVGMELGARKTVTIKATANENATEGDRYLEIARRSLKPKVNVTSLKVVHNALKRDPVVGDVLPSYPGMEIKVVALENNGVTLRTEVTDGVVTPSPWGKVRLRSRNADYYEEELDVRVGDIVRTGGLVGYVSKIGDTMITFDYSHPFGGKELVCDIQPVRLVETASAGEKK